MWPAGKTWAFLAIVLCGTQARAQSVESNLSGVGDHFDHSVVRQIRLFEPLSQHGPDAIRVTVDRRGELAEPIWTVELYPKKRPSGAWRRQLAVGTAAMLDSTVSVPRVVAWERLSIWQSEYEQLAAKVDAALARRDPSSPPGAAGRAGCGEPRVLVERRRHGRTAWLQQQCADDQAAMEIQQMLIDAFPVPLCRYVYRRNGCPEFVESAPASCSSQTGERC